MTPVPPESPPPGLKVVQLIALALIMGAVIFAAIVVVMPPRSGGASGPLRWIPLPLLVMALLTALSLRHALHRGIAPGPSETVDLAAEPPSPEALLPRFVNATIISGALMEGASLFGSVVYLVTRDTLGLVVAGVAVAFMLLVFFPTAARWQRYVAAQRR